MISVITNGGCAGWVLKRRQQREAFDAEQKSLGLFNTELDAIDVVLRRSEADLQKQNAAP